MATIAKLKQLEHVRLERRGERIPWMSDFGNLLTGKGNREELLLQMVEYLQAIEKLPAASRDAAEALVGALKDEEPLPTLVVLLAELEQSLDLEDEYAQEWGKRVGVLREVLQRPARP